MANRAQFKPGDFSLGQVHEWLGAFGRQGGSPEMLQRSIEDAGLMKKIIDSWSRIRNYQNLIADWKKFYKSIGVKPDFTGLLIPPKPEGLDRLLIIAKGMTPQKAYDLCARKFGCWKWTDRNLDEIVSEDRSTTDKAYAVWVRDRVEADEELKDKSADKLKELNIKGITLTEREIYELKYFKETSEHLDIVNITLCTGSRYSGCSVPYVSWYGDYGKVFVSRYDSGDARLVTCSF